MLDKTALKNDLQEFLETRFTAEEAIDEFTNIYDTYATAGVTSLGNTVMTTMMAGLKSALSPLPTLRTAAATAALFGAGILAYWTGGILVPVTPAQTAAIVITPPVAATTTAAILAVATGAKSAEDAATSFANALDTATKTTVIQVTLNTAPPSTATTIFT